MIRNTAYDRYEKKVEVSRYGFGMLVGYGLKYRIWIPVRGMDFYFRDGAHTGFSLYPAAGSMDTNASLPKRKPPAA
jgi:hypothetical protein